MSTTKRTPQSHDQGLAQHSPPQRHSSLSADPVLSPKRSVLRTARVSYLKILVMSLQREIDALEGFVSDRKNEIGNLHEEVRQFEAELILSALLRTGGRQRRAAELLGMKVTTLNSKIKRYKIRLYDLVLEQPTAGLRKAVL